MKKIKSIVLAAGKSQRMGRDKALIEINGKKNIVSIVEELQLFSDEIVVVTSQNYKKIRSILSKFDNVKVILNEKAYLGMFSSVKKGISYLQNADFVFLQPVDSFFIPRRVFEMLMKNLDEDVEFVKPYYQTKEGIKKGGHPIVITRKGMRKIMKADIGYNLKDLMRNSKVRFVITEFEEILFNINTPEELNKILKRKNGNNEN